MKAKKWFIQTKITGKPTDENLKLIEYELPVDLNENEVLFQAVYLTFDSCLVGDAKEGIMMPGEQLSEVIKTRNGQYPLGTLVLSNAGWQSHYISNGKDYNLRPISFDLGRTPVSYTLGTLGKSGATAYSNFNKSEAKKGETILVSGAAESAGNVVGQLAKLKEVNVIGLVETDDKVEWCKVGLGFDHVINYKKENYSDWLAKLAPNGIDMFFDNIGDELHHSVVKHLKKDGKVVDLKASLCQESGNDLAELNKLVQWGNVRVRDTVYYGIEKMLVAYQKMYDGKSFGTTIVKAINRQTNYP